MLNDTLTAPSSRPSTRSSSARRRTLRTAVAVGVAGLSGLALTGCGSVVGAVEHALGSESVQQRHYDAAADAPDSSTSDDMAWFLPSWVPDDARDVDVRLHTSQPGYEISFTSEEGVDLAACEPVDGDLGGPALEPELLPDVLPASSLVTCGDGRVTAQVDGRWYGWTTAEPVPGDDGGTTLR